MDADGRHDQEPRSTAQDVEAGRDPKTPFVALGGTALILGVLFALALGVVVIAYLVAG